MRQRIKEFKEYHNKNDWSAYISTHMGKASMFNTGDEIHIKTRRDEVIAVWQKHGYGYIQECRTKERLEEIMKLRDNVIS